METGTDTVLEWQGYKLVGKYGAVKGCHWLREKLLRGKPCYKEQFYGIESHRCMQMTPVVNICNCQCLFCWRFHGMKEYPSPDMDDPEALIEGMLAAQKEIVSGFGGDSRCEPEMWEESKSPTNVAISLSGEPTLYPRLSDLIEACHKRGTTTFLVTNGTNPRALDDLDVLPTQLYVTIAAPTREIFEKLCIPRSSRLWDRLMETVSMLPSLDTRKVIRHTLVSNWNMGWESEYAALVERSEADFVECKAYMFVGDSRNRLAVENMPSHRDIRTFSERLCAENSYELLDEHRDSRVVLLTRNQRKARLAF
ncbi:MAG TPA: 4-demethylwyosine synthase TYW1 [Euryarchaeota archaeon]|nr:4-demethylwyosine synthase TYW1 [Euryarchaeota archaeon]